MTEYQKLSFLLDGGIDDRSQSELRAPSIAHGSTPKLAVSANTRLSAVRGTPVRAPGITPIAGTGAVGVECCGVAVCESGRAGIEFFLPGAEGAGLGNRAVYGGGASASVIKRALAPTERRGAFVPTTVEPFLGLTQPDGVERHVATAYDVTNQRLWFVSAGVLGVFGYVVDTTGGLVAPPQKLFAEASLSAGGLSLSWHGANGVYLWYEDGTAFRKRQLTLTGSAITVGAETTAYTPVEFHSAFDVCRLDDTFAVIVGMSSSDANDIVIRKHNVTTGAETTATLTGWASGSSRAYCAVACEDIPSIGATRIAVCVSRSSAEGSTTALYDTSLVNLWGPTPTSFVYGQTSVLFQDTADGAYVVSATSDAEGAFSAGTQTSTLFQTFALSTGAASNISRAWWSVQANRGAQLRIDEKLYPTFFLQRAYWGSTPPELGLDDFVDDPDVQCMLVANNPTVGLQVSPIARFGCVRGSAPPARCLPHLAPARSAVGIGNAAYLTYLTERSGLTEMTAYDTRGAVVAVSQGSLRVAHDKGGVALLAGGLPVQWAGTDVTEMGGPLYRPHLKLEGGGTGPAFPAGSYSFLAHYEWCDSTTGQHRSRISNVVTMDSDGTTQPILTLTLGVPDVVNGAGPTLLESVKVRWFGTLTNGITYHEIFASSLTTSLGTIVSYPVVPQLANPQVYSTGEAGQELLPQPPPPLHDVAVVGDRAWGIDAEFRSRAVCTKRKEPGVAYEWHPALEVNFPSGGGRLQVVFELNGTPVFVAERATYYVTGEGPDSTGAGGFFASPTKVSEHGCSNPNAFAEFPGGAVWQDLDRWVVMRGTQTAYEPDVICDFAPIGAITLRRSGEIVFVNREGGAKVYNYELDRWTTWDDEAVPPTTAVANLPHDDYRAFLYSPELGGLQKLDDGTVSDSATAMTLGTDWVLLSGDWQDEVSVHWLVFRAYRAGPHGLRIRIYTDFSATPTTDKTWSNAELLAMADGQGAYTIRCEPDAQRTRAVKIEVSDNTSGETDSAGMRPVALTVYYKPVSNMRTDAFVTGPATK